MKYFLEELQTILSSFLGEPKRDISDSGQLQFGCPKCAEMYGNSELDKFNLEVNVRKSRFNCWKCSSVHDEMHGSIYKLIRMYGNDDILKQYVDAIKKFKESKLYEINFDKDDFTLESSFEVPNMVTLPTTYRHLQKFDKRALEYLNQRGIGWDIINDYEMGVTYYDEDDKMASYRIIIPSRNSNGYINYWTGRDFTDRSKQKYYNPNVERKSLIFNENKVQWDADITLVEGPFDHIVVPNSIPLLGKVLKTDFALYSRLNQSANANINIFLDGDAFDDAKKLYKTLNQGRLYGKIRYIPVDSSLDPSEIYKLYGAKGIISHLSCADKICEVYL